MKDQWYYIPGGSQVMFFNCSYININKYKSEPETTYFSKYWITGDGLIRESPTKIAIITELDTSILIPVTITHILDYYLDNTLPELWA